MNRIEKLLEYLKSEPKDNFLRHALALEYIKLRKDPEAKELLLAILNDSPDYIGSYYQLGKLLERNGETQQAIECYDKGMNAAKHAGDNHTYSELQAAHDELAY